MVRTWAHGNVIIFRTVSQGGTERGGGRAGIHGYIVILRAGTIGAGQWGFSSLKKKEEQSNDVIYCSLSLSLYTSSSLTCLLALFVIMNAFMSRVMAELFRM